MYGRVEITIRKTPRNGEAPERLTFTMRRTIEDVDGEKPRASVLLETKDIFFMERVRRPVEGDSWRSYVGDPPTPAVDGWQPSLMEAMNPGFRFCGFFEDTLDLVETILEE